MKRKSLPTLGLLLGVLFWFADAWIDLLLFNEADRTFWQEAFRPEPAEIYMRVVLLIVFVTFGLYARITIVRQDAIHHELELEIERRRDVERILEELATQDPLTGIYNRRRGMEALRFEIERAHRYTTPLTLILFDVDNFKEINDQYGHEKGDTALCRIAQAVTAALRETDVFSRWGGEEFTVLAPGIDLHGGQALAQKLRTTVQNLTWDWPDPLTISLGIATLGAGDNPASLLDRADRALYEAKRGGKNRLVSLLQ